MLFTYDPRVKCPCQPFITYPYQDVTIERFKVVYGKDDCQIEKSRDMGASWKSLGFFLHRWLFWELQSILLGSRKQEYVDKTGDFKALFTKIDFMMDRLPGWMVPSHTRNQLHLGNHQNGSSIDGESTQKDFGRGDRRTVIFCDEFAAVENSYEIEMATRDTTDCRMYNSTPQGVGNAFHEKRERLAKKNPENLITLHWSVHPKKRRGLYTSEKVKGEFELRILDKKYKWPANFDFVLDGKLRSPWYDIQCERSSSQQEIAQELDIDYAKSGWMMFDEEILQMILDRDCRPPKYKLDVMFDPDDILKKPELDFHDKGKVLLWITLDGTNDFIRSEEFVLGADVALGTGGSSSSNSCASIVGKKSGKKVAEVATNLLPPDEFADLCIALCYWFHSQSKRPAFLIYEENGPGNLFGKRIRERGFTNVYFEKNERAAKDKSTHRMGWRSAKESKYLLFGKYKSALKLGSFRNPSSAAVKECREYKHNPNGEVVHSKAYATKDVDPTASGANHGDRVVADALAEWGRQGTLIDEPDIPDQPPPPGSFGYRMERHKQRERQETVWVD